jgi:molybdenum cofactor cytidylyltransferase
VTFAVVPAAGHSSRMGRPKLTLPLGGRAVIEHVVAALREGGVADVLVVVGPHVLELVPLAAAAGANVLALPAPTADMRATIEAGLTWIEDRFHPRPDDRWLLTPADHPAITADVVRTLLTSEDPIAIPVHGGRRGHPTAFRWRHVAGIRALPADAGVNVFLRHHADQVRERSVPDAGVLADLDTPGDYERLARAGRTGGPPKSPNE